MTNLKLEYEKISAEVHKTLAQRMAATKKAGKKPCLLCGRPRGEHSHKHRFPDYCPRCQEDARQIYKKIHYLEVRRARGLN